MKRIILFLATNLAILLVLSVSMRLPGVEPWLNAQGLNLTSLLISAAVMGFGGSLISLAISKWMAKKVMGVRVIEAPSNTTEAWLVDTVRKYARQTGIGMPEVGIYDAPDVNAFATGMSRNKALIAVSSGLLQQMTREEAQAVLGHEVAHAANGDMVTLALIQGVVNTFVLFLSRVIGHTVDRVIFRTEKGHGPASRLPSSSPTWRWASWLPSSSCGSHAGGSSAPTRAARLAGRGAMIAALERLNTLHPQPLPDGMAAFGIDGGGRPSGIKRLFMTHPPLEERIAALKAGAGR